MKIDARPDVGKKRRPEYPEVGDQLDAIRELAEFVATLPGVELPPKVQAWIEACNAVKRKHPKRQ